MSLPIMIWFSPTQGTLFSAWQATMHGGEDFWTVEEPYVPGQIARLRERMPRSWFLLPGAALAAIESYGMATPSGAPPFDADVIDGWLIRKPEAALRWMSAVQRMSAV